MSLALYHIHVRSHVPGPRDIHLSVARSGLEIIPELAARFGHLPLRGRRGHAPRPRAPASAASAQGGASRQSAEGGRQGQFEGDQGHDDSRSKVGTGSRVPSTCGESGFGPGGVRVPVVGRDGAGWPGGGSRLRAASSG
eukprot:1805954-Pyramimonas_sp.AAC.1